MLRVGERCFSNISSVGLVETAASTESELAVAMAVFADGVGDGMLLQPKRKRYPGITKGKIIFEILLICIF